MLALRTLWLDYIRENGVEHSDPECPEDDTCSCPMVKRINDTLTDTAPLARDIEKRIRADERERCAKAAENCPVVVTDACFEYGKIQIDEARKSIAAAIRGATDAET